MDVDIVLYQYLIWRNFVHMMQSPALILYALKTFDNIKDQIPLDTKNPFDTLNSFKTQFQNNKISAIPGRDGSDWSFDESSKNYFLEAIYFTLTEIIFNTPIEKIRDDQQLTDTDRDKMLIELNPFLENFKSFKDAIFKPMLCAELNKNPEYKDFKIPSNSAKTYDEEMSAFKAGYFELSFIENIYIQILKFMYWVASFFGDKTLQSNVNLDKDVYMW